MKIISYYTLSTPYETVIKECLLPSVEKFNLPYDILGVKDLGSWGNNTGYKSKFVKEMLLKHKEPVCFIDADGIVVKHPELLFNLPPKTDISFHLLNWQGFWKNKWDDNSNMHLLSGTMTFAYNERVLSLIDKWIDSVNKNPGLLEQKCLDNLIKEDTSLNIYHLPMEYCCIIKFDGSICDKVTEPIILHTQASRKYKRGEWRKGGD